MYMSLYHERGQNTCIVCKSDSRLVPSNLKVCVECIRLRPEEALPIALEAHSKARSTLGLPPQPPRSQTGVPCSVCANKCILGEGELGYCGLRANIGGRLKTLTSTRQGLFLHYIDPHVTNCCSAWCCPAGTGVGYPEYATTKGPEIGYYNLAIFFYGCNLDCLFCQNYTHKRFTEVSPQGADVLVDTTLRNRRITCWCFFGGSPEPQLPFAIDASRRVLEAVGSRVLRVCFEWNGCGDKMLVKRAGEIAHRSGGNVKFDLKCWDERLSRALCGVSNRAAFENIALLAESFKPLRREPPLITATTLLVPGYVDEYEVKSIASFLADLDPYIPYSLLVFHPDYLLRDLPVTDSSQLLRCLNSARRYLKRVNVGNIELIGL